MSGQTVKKPSREEAEKAVRTLLEYAGEDPDREGLLETPRRVVKSYDEFYKGYHQDPVEYLSRTFEEVSGYDEMVVLRDIPFESHCEHHMAPIIGKAHIGYLPKDKVVGISKLARLMEIFSRRLQIQEELCHRVADSFMKHTGAHGVAVVIEAQHMCMTCRGVNKQHSVMTTSTMLGVFTERESLKNEFFRLINK